MSNINNRLNKIEKKLSIAKQPKVEYITVHLPFKEGTAPPNFPPETYKTWATYKQEEAEMIKLSKETGLAIFMFWVDPFKEYEVQNNLPEGILSKHELKGKIPFDKLLERTTKSNEKQQNQEKL